MKILSAEQMREADRLSVEAGVSIATLMENAGAAVARFCLRHFPDDGLVVAICGKGNNGGDGMVAARHLVEAGRPVRVLLLGKAGEISGPEARAAFETLDATGKTEAREVGDEEALRRGLEGATLVLDAIVGTGFKPPLRGLAAVSRDLVAQMSVPVVAVDLPSGWDADSTAEQPGPGEGATAFRADAVVTFAAPKPAHLFGAMTDGKVFGPVVVADIGTPPEVLGKLGEMYWAGAAKAVTERPRAINTNKGRFGHVLLMGGSLGKAGAPSMASLAALRAGAGLVTAAVPREVLATVARVTPELMLTPLETSRADGAASEGLSLETLQEESLASLLKGISVVAIGPGLGQAGTTPEFVRRFVKQVTLPMVLDADALNAFAGQADLLRDAVQAAKTKGEDRKIVLTPHPGEMARLVGSSVKEVEADRIGLARRFATENGVTLVLKGWRTLIAHPDGRIAVNTTGNPSMAKGGSGDILTGIVAALVAQYPDNLAEAVEAAVFLHGLAGDFAVLDQDQHTVLATDTVGHLWRAFRSRVVDADGLTWIAGTAVNATGGAVGKGSIH